MRKRLALAILVLMGGTGSSSGQAAEAWHVGRMGNLTIFTCSPPACSSEMTVAVTDTLARALPVGKSILDDAALAARMAEGIAVGIGPSGVIMPFRRADLGPHVGLFGVVQADRGSPMAVFISFKENRSRDFLATAGSVREAIDALVSVAEKAPPP